MTRQMFDVRQLVCLVSMPCSGETHRIGVTTRGRLVLFDHEGEALMTEQKIREEAGLDPACRCSNILRIWAEKDPYSLSEPLRSALRDAMSARYQRRQSSKKPDRLATQTARYRAEERVRKTARKVLKACSYRRGSNNHTNHIELTQDLTKVDVKVEVNTYQQNKRRCVDTEFSLTIPLRWLIRCQRQGIGMVHGMFVVDALPTRRNGSRVVRVLKQSRGFSLKIQRAILTRDGDLQWL